MGLESQALAPKAETIDRRVRFAARFVRVGEYLTLRLNYLQQHGNYWFDTNPIEQGMLAFHRESTNFGEVVHLSKIKRSFNPLVIASRRIIETIPLSGYLGIRQDIIVQAILKNNEAVSRYEESIGNDLELEKAEKKGVRLSKDLDLTNAVGKATGVILP